MKKIFTLLFFLSTISLMNAQCPGGSSIIATEAFESTANLILGTGSGFFNDGTSDHFNVTDGTNISGSESGLSGSFFAAEDIDDNGGTGNSPQSFSIVFDVSNFTDLSFTGLFAQPETGGFDDADDVIVLASIDGGASQTIIDVDEVDDGDAFNQLAQIDGTILTNAAQVFSNTIMGTGTTLTLTVVVDLNGASETIAFDNFTICGIPDVPTPVELTSFRSKFSIGNVDLNWQTSSEINNDFFSIEYSTDARNYKEIAQISGAGNSQTAQNYSYQHRTPANGLNYYRLKQVDYDGTSAFSEVQVVKVDRENPITIYPSHTKHSITVDISEASTSETLINVYDELGRMVISQVLGANTSRSEVNVANLTSGNYFIQFQIDREVFTERFVKMD